jgi:hypothetical protein
MAKCRGLTDAGQKCAAAAVANGYCADHPGRLMTKSEYAAWQGFLPARVSQLLKAGTITDTADGLIDWREADKALAAARDPSMALKRTGTPHPDALVVSRPGADTDAGDFTARFIRARALHEEEKHKLAELKRLEEERRLVDAEEVALQWAHVGAVMREKLRTLPVRLANQLAACETATEARALLAKEIDAALTALSEGFSKGDDDD